MKIIAELHSHTNVSGHAFNTILEMCSAAHKTGLEAIAITNHTSGLVDSPTHMHFGCYKYLPRTVENIFLISGCEANIIDFDGNIDLDEKILSGIDYRIASKHDPSVLFAETRWGTTEENSAMYLGLMKNKYIDCIGHCGNYVVPFEHEPVIKEAAAQGKVVELNVSYPKRSQASFDATFDIMKLCKKYGALTAVTTDAHSIFVLGQNEIGIKMLEDINYPEELVINSSMKNLRKFFIDRKGRDIFTDKMCL